MWERMMETDLTVRELILDDWDDICRVHDAASFVELERSGYDRSQFKPMQEEETRASFFAINRGAVGCFGRQTVGFVAWRDQGEWRDSGYLSYLYVDPAYHRHGIGTRLLNEAVPYLGDQAWTLAKPENQAAVSLYRKFGMETVNHRDTRCGIRLALFSSKKFDPDVPNFGTPYAGI